MNVIELQEWSYFPDESHPREIRVSVVVHQSGRFAGNVTGEANGFVRLLDNRFRIHQRTGELSVRCVAERLSHMHSR